MQVVTTEMTLYFDKYNTALYKIFINEPSVRCANHSSVIYINKSLIPGLRELKTKEKSSWVIPISSCSR